MNRIFMTAAIAAVAMTATAADARPSARQRGVASGQEARERMATKELNAQQLAGGGAAMAGSAGMAGGSAMSADTPMGSAGGSTTVMAATGGTMAPATGAPDPASPPMSDASAPTDPAAMSGTTGGMPSGSAGMAGMDHSAMMQKDGKWMMGDRPATKAEIAAHKQMMKDNKPM